MIGEFKMPPCPHNQPFTGSITVIATTMPTCSFCERDRMRDEITSLKQQLRDVMFAKTALVGIAARLNAFRLCDNAEFTAVDEDIYKFAQVGR